MSFVPGDKVQFGSDPTARVIEGIVVFYDYKSKQVWGSPHLDFGGDSKNQPGGKRFISIDDVVWMTAQGQPVDMRKAVKMAEGDKSIFAEGAETAEGEMVKLLRQAHQRIQAIPDIREVQKSEIVLELTKEFPYQKELPVGWETSVLFSLGITPQYLQNSLPNGKSEMKSDAR